MLCSWKKDSRRQKSREKFPVSAFKKWNSKKGAVSYQSTESSSSIKCLICHKENISNRIADTKQKPTN